MYVDNLTNEKIELSRNYVYDQNRVGYGRPLTVGARVSYNFD